MPGYVIHLAVAQEYLKKHKNRKENYYEFIEGVIYPDSVKDKSKTNYGPKSGETNIIKFLEENNIQNSFERGYLLHLVTDYLFYNKYIDTYSIDIYNDYDILNKRLIEKYEVKIPEKVKNKIFFKDDIKLKILSMELVEKLIDEVSSLNLDIIAEQVKEEPEKWTEFRTLKYID